MRACIIEFAEMNGEYLADILAQLPPNTRIKPWSYRTFKDTAMTKELVEVPCLILESGAFKDLREGEFPTKLKYELATGTVTQRPCVKLFLDDKILERFP